jgi:hypothetical protein
MNREAPLRGLPCGRNRTRTCDLFCVREEPNESMACTGVHSVYCVHGVNKLGDRIVHGVHCVHTVNSNCTKISPRID